MLHIQWQERENKTQELTIFIKIKIYTRQEKDSDKHNISEFMKLGLHREIMVLYHAVVTNDDQKDH